MTVQNVVYALCLNLYTLSKLYSSFLNTLYYPFYLKYYGSKFLKNAGTHLPNYMASHARKS
jgi:hypothetical protein